MKIFFNNLYEFLQQIPDRLYPFSVNIEGKVVRGKQAYVNAITVAFATYGPHRLGYKLMVYRGMFHFLGSVFFIVCSALLSRELFGSEIAFYILIGIAIGALSFQEFYLHSKHYQQPRIKTVTDWLTWIIPMVGYIFFINF